MTTRSCAQCGMDIEAGESITKCSIPKCPELPATPRTDAVYCPEFGMILRIDAEEGYIHACKLERELAAARSTQSERAYPIDKIESVHPSFDYVAKDQHIPWVMVCFKAGDWDSRDAFAKAISKEEL